MAYLRLRRDLAAPIVPAPLPAGMRLVPFDRPTAKACRELLQRLYPEGLNDGGISFDGFWTWLTGDPEYDPELIFVVRAGNDLAGFCHCWSGCFIKDVAVAPEFRRRGLGAALVTLALEAFKARDAAAVDLKTDVENHKAQSLYRRLGFVIVERVA